MNDKTKELIDEFRIIIPAFAIMYVMFQAHYYNENVITILKAVFAHFYLFIVPGYSMCLIFRKDINRLERLIIGAGVGYGLQPFFLYLINYFVKINIMHYNLYVSALLILAGIGLYYVRGKNSVS